MAYCSNFTPLHLLFATVGDPFDYKKEALGNVEREGTHSFWPSIAGSCCLLFTHSAPELELKIIHQKQE
jgi:hypothetical protein